MSTIETARLLLRRYRAADAPRVLDIHSRMDVIRWLDNPPFVPMADLDESRAWIERANDKEPPTGTLAIEVRETGEVAGSVVVSRMTRLDEGFVGEYEIGWHLHPDSTGHGYVTEAAAAMLDQAFDNGLAELWCDMYPDNTPSIAVAQRLGFEDRGEIDDPWYGGVSRLFHVAAADWSRRPAI